VPDVTDHSVADRLIPIVADVSNSAEAAEALRSFADGQSGLSGLVNAAGYHEVIPSAELSLDELRAILETNLIGAVNLAQTAFSYLADKGGWIVNIGSFYDRLGVPASLGYSASKAGMASVTRTLAVEWARYGITVLDFAPGYVETRLNEDYLQNSENRAVITRQIPVRRVGDADEVARLIGAVVTAECGFLTGVTIYVDGGQGIRR
jgi:NAD(P)-dependent dehydrogenase (short-subunit alcohol dehydrogenase family)